MLLRLLFGVLYYLSVCVLRLVCSDQTCYDSSRHWGPLNAGCMDLVNRYCLGAPQINEYLVGESFDLECTLDAPTPTFTVSRHSCVAATADVIVDDGSNYTINGRTLTIHNVQPNDEGFYACSSGGGGTRPIACVVVSGLARFAMCDPTDPPVQYSYIQSRLISRSNSCYQKLNVTEGRITLDTRIMYSPGGCCNCIEDITRFAIFKGAVTIPTSYTCNDTPDSDCPSSSEVVVKRHSDLFYDFSVELQLEANDTAQLIYVQIEVAQPMLTSSRSFWKVFDVTVNQDLTTTSPPATTLPVTNDDTPGSAGVGGLNPSGVPVSAGVVGGAVGAVVVIVLMVVAVVVVIALVLQYKRQRTDSEALEMKNKEPFYETIRTGKPQNINSVGVPYRGSVYTDFEGTVTLQPNLESKTSAQV